MDKCRRLSRDMITTTQMKTFKLHRDTYASRWKNLQYLLINILRNFCLSSRRRDSVTWNTALRRFVRYESHTRESRGYIYSYPSIYTRRTRDSETVFLHLFTGTIKSWPRLHRSCCQSRADSRSFHSLLIYGCWWREWVIESTFVVMTE